jgi:hypothetical protein
MKMSDYLDEFGRPKRINVSFSPSVAKKLDEIKLVLYDATGLEMSYSKIVEYLLSRYAKDRNVL